MSNEIFARIFNLIKKTGDKFVVINPDSASAYVVMRLDDYEKIVGASNVVNLTAKESTDKIEEINRDIAAWREEEVKKTETPIISEDRGDQGTRGEEAENQFYFEPVE